MDKGKNISCINQVIEEYFHKNPNQNKIQAKELMPQFIKASIFNKDKLSLPIRSLLRSLDEENNLNAIPSALGEKKNTNTNWFFIRPNSSKIINKVKSQNSIVPSATVKSKSIKRTHLTRSD